MDNNKFQNYWGNSVILLLINRVCIGTTVELSQVDVNTVNRT